MTQPTCAAKADALTRLNRDTKLTIKRLNLINLATLGGAINRDPICELDVYHLVKA